MTADTQAPQSELGRARPRKEDAELAKADERAA